MVSDPSRRSLLRSGLCLAASSALAGCSSRLRESGGGEVKSPNVVERIHVRNESDTDDLFDLSLVRNGEHEYFGQLDLPAGDSKLVAGRWETAGRTFVTVGESKAFCNHEVRALDANYPGDEQHAYEGRFVIEKSGDVSGSFYGV